MEILSTIENEKCPKVFLDKEKGVFQIIGRSVPEDARKFYDPIIDWLEEYVTKPNRNTIFHFELDYFNTASSMMILAIILKLKLIHGSEGKEVLVKWNFDDEDMKDAGINFEEASGIPFEHIGEINDDF